MPTLDFAFDFISPYAYFGWCGIHAVADRHGYQVRPVPVLFAAMLNHHGQLGPAEIPAKRHHTFMDCQRTARRLGLPFAPPPAHPFNPLLALRVASLPQATDALITALFQEVWAGGRGVTEPEVVAAVAAAHGIPDAIERAAEPEAKAAVRTATEAAIARGAFGVPTVWVGESLFWGHDSFANLEEHLAGRGIGAEAWQAFADLPAQARRTR